MQTDQRRVRARAVEPSNGDAHIQLVPSDGSQKGCLQLAAPTPNHANTLEHVPRAFTDTVLVSMTALVSGELNYGVCIACMRNTWKDDCGFPLREV